MTQVTKITDSVELENNEIRDKDIPQIMDDIVSRMEQLGFNPNKVEYDIDTDDNIIISFSEIEVVHKMMLLNLIHGDGINIPNYIRETLDFLYRNCHFNVSYYGSDTVHIPYKYQLMIMEKCLPKFKELFFEVFPSEEYFEYLSSIINE